MQSKDFEEPLRALSPEVRSERYFQLRCCERWPFLVEREHLQFPLYRAESFIKTLVAPGAAHESYEILWVRGFQFAIEPLSPIDSSNFFDVKAWPKIPPFYVY